MKQSNSLLFWISLTLFIILFYNQFLGINLLIFSIFLILFTIVKKGKEILSFEKITFIIAILISGFSSAYFADWYSKLINILSLLVFPFIINDPEKKLIFSWVKSLFNYLIFPIKIIENKIFGNTFIIKEFWSKLFKICILPMCVIGLFISLYSNINQDFNQLIETIKFPEINFSFIGLFLLGFFLLTGFWFYKSPLELEIYFGNYVKNDFENYEINEKQASNRSINFNSGILLFSILNFLLFTLLCFEMQDIFIGFSQLDEIQLNTKLHSGIDSIKISIVFAIILIMIYFNKSLSVFEKNKKLKIIAFVWIFLNVFLCFISFYKNIIFIDYFGLTLKRLGVFGFLGLSLIGLIFTFLKIGKMKTNYFLIRNMLWVFFIFSVIITPINWSNFITKYEINTFKNGKGSLEMYYLINLPDYNSVTLNEFQKEIPKLTNEQKNRIISFDRFEYNESGSSNEYQETITEKYNRVKKEKNKREHFFSWALWYRWNNK